MIYRAIRRIVKISLSIFFKKIVVTGSENIPENGPLIIAANHPNTFMDPMIVAAITEQRIGFVANAGIFKNKLLISIFRFLHIIPIYRKKDVASGEKPDNRETFLKCHEYLNENRTLLIFPEGSSYYELKLREIKTGTARIALSFELSKEFDGKLRILPVALDYSDSIQFRSMVSVTVYPPISVSVYKEIYLHDEYEGVNRLTEDIRMTLAENIPSTINKDQENYLIKAHKFYTAYFEPYADLYVNPKRSLELRKQLSEALHYIYKHDNPLYLETQTMILEFFHILKAERLTTGFFSDQFLRKNKTIVCLSYILKFVLLLPIYIFGLITNYLPYILPSKIFESTKLAIEFKAPLQMTVGVITFPVYYGLMIWLFRHYVSAEFSYSVILLISLPVFGYLAMYYWTEVKRFVRVVRFYFFMDFGKKNEMLNLRDEILGKMEDARKSLGRQLSENK